MTAPQDLETAFADALAAYRSSGRIDDASGLMRRLRSDPATLHTLYASGDDARSFIGALSAQTPTVGNHATRFAVSAVLVWFVTLFACAPPPNSDQMETRSGLRNFDGTEVRTPRDPLEQGALDDQISWRQKLAEAMGVPSEIFTMPRCEIERGLFGSKIIGYATDGSVAFRLNVKREVQPDVFTTRGRIGGDDKEYRVVIDTDSSCTAEGKSKVLDDEIAKHGSAMMALINQPPRQSR